SIYLVRSDDGLTFTDERLFVHHGGVPNLLLTRDNKSIATFQYFSFEHEEMFDVIAYTVSEDFGKTWSKVNKIYFEGLPTIGFGGPNPVDPTLVELENGSFRLYFTYHTPGRKYPGLYSAISDALDTPFKSEGPQLETDKMILDPAVVYFNGLWHHYTVRHGEEKDGKSVNVHSISTDGKNFELQDDILLKFQLLGQVIEDGGRLRFYGSGDGVQSATSSDGYIWTEDSGRRVMGADPGIAKLPDGRYLMIYTKLPPK
ncbi:MAG: exo-alpha-sialidase, partial [Candidatus Zixiibacteriota bacterium]